MLCRERNSLLALGLSAIGAVGCSGSSQSVMPSDSGGAATSGGAPGSGGTPDSGGRSNAGANPSAGGTTVVVARGGSAGSGGNAPTGGINGEGGLIVATGGTKAAGGTTVATGGTKASGGSSSTGGSPAIGGANAMGGLTAGGAKATGGNTATGGAKATGGATSTATFHVFLLLGQSNMAGYPKALASDKVEDPRVKVLGYDACSATGRQTDQWDMAAPPLHECWNSAIGPGDYFAKTLLTVIPSTDTIGLVPCAISGEKIETFMKVGGTKYNWIVSRAKLAQQAGGVIDGILFHQGESNNGDTAWPGKVNTLVTDLKADLGLGHIPFLAGELLYSGACAGHNTLVNKLPSVVTNAFVVSASGLVVDPADTEWNLHFDHDSQVTFGKRYAQAMIAALKW